MLQIVLSFIILGVFIAGVFLFYLWQKRKSMGIASEDTLTHEVVVERVTRRIVEMVRVNTFRGKDDREWKVIYDNCKRIEEALAQCVYVIEKDVITTQQLFISILEEIFKTKEDLLKVYPYDAYNIDPMWQFEILMERLYPEYKKDTYSYLVKKYHWDRIRINEKTGRPEPYKVTEADLREAYDMEVIGELTFREMLSVTATLLMQEMKTPGCLTTLLMQNIDGINAGVSGSLLNPRTEEAATWRGTRSVWVYFEGKYIHNQFFDFRTHDELKRCVQLIAMYDNPGPMTMKRTYIVNTMADKSRVLAIRPQAGECWAVFIRKFVLKVVTLDALLDPVLTDFNTREPVLDDLGNPVHKFKNAQLACKTVEYIMETETNAGFTGRQGSGKTTIMIASIPLIDSRYNKRVLEMSPEMYLREMYPLENLYSVQETPHTSAQDLQDALKKSDAAITITAEIATDIIAAKTVQLAQLNSISTFFSHHANRASDLVNALTNSVVAASGGAIPPEIVLPQILDVVKTDIHLNYDVEGNRFIERITEIIPIDSTPYPVQEPGESLAAYKVRLDREYYTRRTDRVLFTTRDILVYNRTTKSYSVARDENGKPVFFTDTLLKQQLERLHKSRLDHWMRWISENWEVPYAG